MALRCRQRELHGKALGAETALRPAAKTASSSAGRRFRGRRAASTGLPPLVTKPATAAPREQRRLVTQGGHAEASDFTSAGAAGGREGHLPQRPSQQAGHRRQTWPPVDAEGGRGCALKWRPGCQRSRDPAPCTASRGRPEDRPRYSTPSLEPARVAVETPRAAPHKSGIAGGSAARARTRLGRSVRAVPRLRARCGRPGSAPRALIGPFEQSGRRGASGASVLVRGAVTALGPGSGEYRGATEQGGSSSGSARVSPQRGVAGGRQCPGHGLRGR